jgi:hypothetical protein
LTGQRLTTESRCDNRRFSNPSIFDVQANASRRNSLGEGKGGTAPGCAGENHLVREQRTPFVGNGVVVRRAAGEFVTAIGFSDEAGGAEDGDEVAGYATEKAEI